MSDLSTRDQIIAAADRLFYRQGYERTSFSDIADVVRISRGNFYYHFKSKDEILDAVIEARLAEVRTMLGNWEQREEDPAGRIRSFIRMLLANRTDIKRFGCPVGTLSAELAKLNHPAQPEASGLFGLFRAWLRQQFVLLGREADADALAMHLLAWSQGVASLANALRDDAFIQREVAEIDAWLAACIRAPGRKRQRRSAE